MADKLKPCPFCGSARVRIVNGAEWIKDKYQKNIRAVSCYDCGVNGGIFSVLGQSEEAATEKAIKSWNTRPARKVRPRKRGTDRKSFYKEDKNV